MKFAKISVCEAFCKVGSENGNQIPKDKKYIVIVTIPKYVLFVCIVKSDANCEFSMHTSTVD